MKKAVVLLLVGAMIFSIAACGEKGDNVSVAGKDVSSESVVIEESKDGREQEEKGQEEQEQSQPEQENNESGNPMFTDNFSVDINVAAAFGARIKKTVAEQDLETFADLASYPLYVGFADGGVSVNSREEMIELGAEKIFTEEFLAAIAAADENAVSASRAGFVLTDEGKPNIVFGVAGGKLAITGMNY